MITYYDGKAERRFVEFDRTNREEHAALLKAIAGLGERIAAVEGKLDILIAQKPSS